MLSGYKKHKDHESAPPPLTDQELELELVKQQEVRKRISFLLKAVAMYCLKSGTEKSTSILVYSLDCKQLSLLGSLLAFLRM